MDYSTIKSISVDLGFTPDKITPLFVVLLIGIILINKRMKPVEELTKKIEGFIIRLCGAIESGGKIENVELYSNSSPLKITPRGMEILGKIGFKEAVDNNLEVLFKIVDGLGAKSALDVETVCIGIIRYWITDQRNNTFKDVKDSLNLS